MCTTRYRSWVELQGDKSTVLVDQKTRKPSCDLRAYSSYQRLRVNVTLGPIAAQWALASFQSTLAWVSTIAILSSLEGTEFAGQSSGSKRSRSRSEEGYTEPAPFHAGCVSAKAMCEALTATPAVRSTKVLVNAILQPRSRFFVVDLRPCAMPRHQFSAADLLERRQGSARPYVSVFGPFINKLPSCHMSRARVRAKSYCV